MRGQRLFQPLGAFAERTNGQAAAIGAGLRRSTLVAAVVAAQALVAPVQGHRAFAVRTLRAPAAVAAEQDRRIAAPVLEHQCLLPAPEAVGDRLQCRLCEAVVEMLVAQVDHLQGRRLRHAGAAAQMKMPIAAGCRIGQAFQRRRGRAQHDRNAERLRAQHGQVACVVAETFLLLVGRVVFFVDDDRARLRQRHEQRRACTEHDARLAARRGQPGERAFGFVEARVQRGDVDAEPLAEPPECLRSQRDFRHQHQRLPATREAGADDLQIDLGLAAAGDAFEQERRKALAGDDCFGRALLLIVQRWPGIGRGAGIAGRNAQAFDPAARGGGAQRAGHAVEGIEFAARTRSFCQRL